MPDGLRVADRGRRAGLGHRDHQVGLGRERAGQPAADLDPHAVDALVGDQGVRSGQVDELEQASLGRRLGEAARAQPVLVDRDQLTGLDLADVRRTDDVQRRRLRGHHPAAFEPAEHQRPDALGVAGGVQRVLVHPHERERSAQQRQHLDGALLQRGVGVVGEQCRDQAGVVGRVVLEVAGMEVELARCVRQLLDQPLQLEGVGQVAVVRERDRPVGRRPERRLGVGPGAAAGGRVARVTHREVALERLEGGLVEDLGDQAHVLVHQDLAPVADRDPGRLLAPVLEGVEAEVAELRDVLPRRPDTEDTAGVLGSEVVRVEVVRQSAVSATACPGVGPATSRSLRVEPDDAVSRTVRLRFCDHGRMPAPEVNRAMLRVRDAIDRDYARSSTSTRWPGSPPSRRPT